MTDTHHAPQRTHPGRRTYLLDREFQLKYILLLASIGAAGTGLFGALAYRVHRGALAAAGLEGGGSGTTLLWLAGLAVLGMGAALGLFGLVFTHRVAGPVHVMSLYMAALAAGRYPRLRPLRQRDELRRFFERFGEAVDRIRQREAEEARLLGEALAALGPLATTAQARGALQALEALQARKSQAIETTPSGAFKSLA
ncbi:signal protein [Myxococcaceae bacterium GXIMD 01537]